MITDAALDIELAVYASKEHQLTPHGRDIHDALDELRSRRIAERRFLADLSAVGEQDPDIAREDRDELSRVESFFEPSEDLE